VGLLSGCLDFTLVEQLAWYALGGDAEESAEEGADRGQAPGELGGVGIVYSGVDDGAYAGTDAD
jgi:hypothetical protein